MTEKKEALQKQEKELLQELHEVQTALREEKARIWESSESVREARKIAKRYFKRLSYSEINPVIELKLRVRAEISLDGYFDDLPEFHLYVWHPEPHVFHKAIKKTSQCKKHQETLNKLRAELGNDKELLARFWEEWDKLCKEAEDE